ncbi:MAG: DUF58 domain-containing protein [bacterium]|nr:DUF58 domain-containing protein [bacterium]
MGSKFTAMSVVFLILTVFTVSVASVFNHPLLVYTAVFMVTSNVALFVWAHTAVRTLEIERLTPKFGVAGQPLDVTVKLRNKGHATRFGLLGFDLHSRLTPGQDYSPVAFLEAQADSVVESGYQVAPPKRGQYRLGPFYLYGGDPFGFYKSWNKFERFTDVLVLPCPVEYKIGRPRSLSRLAREELETLPVQGQSLEFLGVREYRQGEPPKNIHWRTSARLGKLISRQYEKNVTASVSVLLMAEDGMTIGTPVDSPLEYSITLIASLAYATTREPYRFHYLAILGERSEHHDGSGPRFYQELAIQLARLAGVGRTDWGLARRLIINHLPRHSSLVVFVAELTTATREELNKLGTHFRQITVVTFDRSSFERGQVAASSLGLPGRGYRVITVGFQDDLRGVLGRIFSRPAAKRAVSA